MADDKSLFLSYDFGEVNEALRRVFEMMSNPNLLHNWDFRNPVNQRGQSSYTDVHNGKYTIDRWCGLTPWGTTPANVTIQPGVGIEIESVPNPDFPSAFGALVQKIENAAVYSGYTLTFSAEVASVQVTDGGIYPKIRLGDILKDITGPGIFSVTKTFDAITELLAEIFVYAGATTSNSVVIKRCKLELGTVSTLAYDPPADYGAELRKCQRYLKDLAGIYRLAYRDVDVISFSTENIANGMRISAPSIIVNGSEPSDWRVATLPDGSIITGFTLTSDPYGWGTLAVIKTGHGLDDAIIAIKPGKIFASAEL